LVVDDGSTDRTAARAEQAGVRLIRHTANRGKGQALRNGFAAATGYDIVVTLDADGQHAPEDVPRLVAALQSADLVVGARPRTRPVPAPRRLGNDWSARFLSWLAGTPIPDVQSGFRAHRAALLIALGLQAGEGADGHPAPPPFHATGYGFESEIL